MERRRTGPRRMTGLFLVGVVMLATACGPGQGGPGSPGEGGSMTASPTPEPAGPTSSRTPAAPESLTIVVRDGAGTTTNWTLTCDPVGGTHPDPAAACAALTAHGTRALPPVAKDRACTQIYGGDQTATITGSWQGRPVRSSFSLRDGCEIARWRMLQGLLPPAGA